MTSHGGEMVNLFDSVQASFPSSLSPHGWYIITASALIAFSPASLGQLYTYVTRQLDLSTPRHVINTRFREILIKQAVTLGGPRVAIALWALRQAEEPGDVDPTFTRSSLKLDAANHERSINYSRRVLGEKKAANQFENIGANIDWLYRDVFYGLLLSDEAVLSLLETQTMTCTALACEDGLILRPLLIIHLGGLRNLGASLEQAEAVMTCVEMVAKYLGKDTASWLPVRKLIPNWETEGQPVPNPSAAGKETAGDARNGTQSL